MSEAVNPYEGQEPIHEECNGCDRIGYYEEVGYCPAYADPSVWWRRGACPLGSHVENGQKEVIGKKRVGQQKSKKRRSRR